MKRLTSLFCGLALVLAASVTNADTITIPGPGNFGSTELFDFTAALGTINSVTMDLTYGDAAAVGTRPQILAAGAGGAQLGLLLFPDGGLSGTYTFVPPGSGALPAMLPGVTSTTAGVYEPWNWNPGSPPPQFGWNLQFIGDSSGTFDNVSIDFTPASAAIPEPGSALAVLAFAGLAFARRRR